jgi:hypothetical protein
MKVSRPVCVRASNAAEGTRFWSAAGNPRMRLPRRFWKGAQVVRRCAIEKLARPDFGGKMDEPTIHPDSSRHSTGSRPSAPGSRALPARLLLSAHPHSAPLVGPDKIRMSKVGYDFRFVLVVASLKSPSQTRLANYRTFGYRFFLVASPERDCHRLGRAMAELEARCRGR